MRPDAAAALLLAAALAFAPAVQALDAPNVVVISPTLVTSGQPTRQSLERLGAEGFEVVIYLAPPTVRDAIADEPAIVERQGLRFINIPIPFDAPAAAHFKAFADAMQAAGGRKVLVHCQVNMRASTMVFLLRTVTRGEPPEAAYRDVARVWSPDGPWKRLAVDLLRGRGIAFEPY